MLIAFANDQGGFDQREELVSYIESLGHTVEDFGIKTKESIDYPLIAKKASQFVASGNAKFGILICGTGIGMSLSANKVNGIRCANVIKPEFAKLARRHNDANMISLSGRYVDVDDNKELIKIFLETSAEGERHHRRVMEIMEIESENHND